MHSLLESGAEVDREDTDGKTPLFHASKGGISRAIPLLIYYGADIRKKDSLDKKTPLEVAQSDKIRKLIISYTSEKVEEINKEDKLEFNEGKINKNSTLHGKVIELKDKVPPKKIINPYEEKKGE